MRREISRLDLQACRRCTEILLNTPGFELDVSSLRYGVCGAAPMPVETIRKFEATFNMIIIEGTA